jgi:hypothetical protein
MPNTTFVDKEINFSYCAVSHKGNYKQQQQQQNLCEVFVFRLGVVQVFALAGCCAT